MSKKVLGRGLGAYFPDIEEGKEPPAQSFVVAGSAADSRVNVVLSVPVSHVRANPFQPRKDFDEIRLQELADSVREHGLIQPITVRHIGDRRYELIAGERRLRAARMAGLESVPAYIREVNDEQSLVFALIENLQREELNAIEIAMGYQRLMEECDLTQEQVAARVGKSRPAVANFLRLLSLPPAIQFALKQGRISNGHARSLITIADPKLQQELLEKAILEDYSVRQLEEAVRALENRKKPVKKSQPKSSNVYFKDITSRLVRRFGTKVDIKKKQRGGEIRISYFSEEDLERLLSLFDDQFSS